MIPRLKTLYYKEVKNMLKEKYGFKNLNMAPQFEKVVLNMGLGVDGNDSKIFTKQAIIISSFKPPLFQSSFTCYNLINKSTFNLIIIISTMFVSNSVITK